MFDDEADVCHCEECQGSAEKATGKSWELGSSADLDGIRSTGAASSAPIHRDPILDP